MESSRGSVKAVLCCCFIVGIVAVSVSALSPQRPPNQNPPTHVRCRRDSDCSCTMTDLSGRYDLSTLSAGPEGSAPYFNRFPGSNSSESFSYDPCYPFSLTDPEYGRTACQSVASCRIDSSVSSGSERRVYTNIAKHITVQFMFDDLTETMTLMYTNEDIFNPITAEVHLNCLEESKPTMIELVKATARAVSFRLSSPNACLIRPPPSGLSMGSILCILFSVAFIAYFVGGTAVSVFVYNKPLSDAIPPNRDFWLDLPSLIKDGAAFALSGFQGSRPTHQRLGGGEADDPQAYHDDDANDDDDEVDELKVKRGGGPSESSDGFTAVAV